MTHPTEYNEENPYTSVAGDEQELTLYDINGNYSTSICPLVKLVDEDGVLKATNDYSTYIFTKDDYHTYKIGNCDCSSSKWNEPEL